MLRDAGGNRMELVFVYPQLPGTDLLEYEYGFLIPEQWM